MQYKIGQKTFVIMGFNVRACEVIGHPKEPKFVNLHQLGTNNKFFKQKTHCYKTEIEALEALIEKLEEALDKAETKMAQIINKKINLISR